MPNATLRRFPFFQRTVEILRSESWQEVAGVALRCDIWKLIQEMRQDVDRFPTHRKRERPDQRRAHRVRTGHELAVGAWLRVEDGELDSLGSEGNVVQADAHFDVRSQRDADRPVRNEDGKRLGQSRSERIRASPTSGLRSARRPCPSLGQSVRRRGANYRIGAGWPCAARRYDDS
jgi:hypothetical protein